ncbi:site-specific DNA-methyltransferase [soil metagenome]
MVRRKKPSGRTPIENVRHKDKRVNIPTEELRGFVADNEETPGKMLYPRDPSLDPQLVWKGKDEQDAADLAVPVVPVYIQEKLHPKALIENLRATAAAGEVEPELTLFDDFNGIEFEELVDFYQHEQNWANRMILGDSLMVMASLAEKEGLKGKVQMIYLDPPYGIKFGSNWQVSTRKRDVKDGKAEDVVRQPEQVKAFRDTWELGIHSYLSYLRDRLVVARDLLTESGSIFVQIGDENVHLVRSLLDEVFGGENFVSLISFVTTSGFQTNELARAGDYLLWYANDQPTVKVRRLWQSVDRQSQATYRWLMFDDGTYRGLTSAEQQGEVPVPEGARRYVPGDLQSQGSASALQPFEYRGKTYSPGSNSHWKAEYPRGMDRLALAGRIHIARSSIRYVRYADDFGHQVVTNLWNDTGTGNFTDDKLFVVQTNTKVIQRCMLLCTDPGDLVLDPTCGSGTTAHVAEQWGRRWITVDTSRVALALARTRLMTARYPYFLLADSAEGVGKQAELDQAIPSDAPVDQDIRKGFVYKTVPHVTLKSIANNPDIKEGMSRAEIDSAIARRADKEVLYDQPYEDPKRLRVAGPFTVESLSPHRTIDAGDERRPVSEVVTEPEADGGRYETTILDNLRKAGVQNSIKDERLVFDRLEPYAGRYIQAEGEFTDKKDKVNRVAVSLGPEHGTVGKQQVQEAAKEAVLGVGFDVLIVCGFAFDAHVSEDAKRYGKLTVLPVHMNPDLAMGDELLKKTGAGNLFMVFGEPDLVIKEEEGRLVAEIHGLDVYDPTTGQVRSNSTDDIACWFIDTNYNGESFFVRHAYFTGADKPYDKLKRALKADIDEDAWSSLYSTRSRAFDKPTTGRIAVKVINHYGDEVLKVYEV